MDLEALGRNWDEFGKQDPLWAIRTEPDKRGGKWDVEEFFRSGQDHVSELVARLDELGMRDSGSVLDFGCGVGRLTQAFADHFAEVWGIDIAPSMIEGAQAFNRHGERVHYVVNRADDLGRFDDDTFDVVFSVIVLQHIHPDISLGYLREFFRVCKPGGTVVFQLPSHLLRDPFPDDAYSAEITAEAPSRVIVNRFFEVLARLRNTGGTAWPRQPDALRLGNHWLDTSGTVVHNDSGREPVADAVAPGEVIDIVLRVPAPPAPGRYVLELDVVHEGITWFAERGSPPARFEVDVEAEGEAAPRRRRFGRRVRGGREQPAVGTDGAVVSLDEPVMEMHAVPRDDVLALIAQLGGSVFAVDRNDNAPPWESYTYYAVKPATRSRNDA